MPDLDYLNPTQFRAKYPQIPPRDILPTGVLLVKIIDETGCRITPEERDKILNLTTPEQMSEFLAAQTMDLGPVKAKNDFARFIARLDVPATLIIYHFECLGAAQRAVCYVEDALKQENLTAHDKTELLNTMILAIHAQGKMIQNAAFLMRALFNKDQVKKPRSPKSAVPESAPLPKRAPPKNKAPDILADEAHFNGNMMEHAAF